MQALQSVDDACFVDKHDDSVSVFTGDWLFLVSYCRLFI